MIVEGVRRCGCESGHPLVALAEPRGDRWLNVRVSDREADHLAHELGSGRTRAAFTYTLLGELLSALGWTLSAVRLTGTEHQEVLGLVEVTRGDERAGVRAHPGDAIVLAYRYDLAVEVPVEMARMGDRGLAAEWLADGDSDELASFRRFLDELTPDDFAS
ncbi:MAG: bifunctional nuclease domain-containing protein [Actinomycetota bacterium]